MSFPVEVTLTPGADTSGFKVKSCKGPQEEKSAISSPAPTTEFSAATVIALRDAPGLATVLLENGSKFPSAPPGS